MLRLDTLGFRVFPLAPGCSVRHDLRHGWHDLQRVGDDWKAYVTSLARLTPDRIRVLAMIDDRPRGLIVGDLQTEDVATA